MYLATKLFGSVSAFARANRDAFSEFYLVFLIGMSARAVVGKMHAGQRSWAKILVAVDLIIAC